MAKKSEARPKRPIYDNQGLCHFLTFSCYRRRNLLGDNRAKGIVIHYLGKQLKNQNGNLAGFVIMPNHVHALVRFDENNRLSVFMSQWKRRSSIGLKDFFKKHRPSYYSQWGLEGPIWQPKYYSFEIYSEDKFFEKLEYMHNNPVRAGLVEHAKEWGFGSAPWYLAGKPIGVPIHSLR